MKNPNKVLILDRDGVINEDLWDYVKVPEDFKPIHGSIESIATLYQSGYKITVATNQACIGKGIISDEELKRVHNFMLEIIEEKGGKVDCIAYCPHSPEEKCNCRKPEIGLLTKIENELKINLEGSYFIGDKESDVLAARNFGCIPLLVKTGYGKKTLESPFCPKEEHCFEDLKHAAAYILKNPL
ncbi:MAG: D-glycero-beta-D-manno-heptose 1,7-bisphosphate 7-phosphatase [SAR86 cluster bacterium]|jgi:D-glycero-D-manno-heptose 1,7-bisphosphate phosphatase|nr:D-glycero-beta-D-manno-heptose 1,7-bisphosphate 7-phosphatase [SAR86 cluster bacterium]